MDNQLPCPSVAHDVLTSTLLGSLSFPSCCPQVISSRKKKSILVYKSGHRGTVDVAQFVECLSKCKHRKRVLLDCYSFPHYKTQASWNGTPLPSQAPNSAWHLRRPGHDLGQTLQEVRVGCRGDPTVIPRWAGRPPALSRDFAAAGRGAAEDAAAGGAFSAAGFSTPRSSPSPVLPLPPLCPPQRGAKPSRSLPSSLPSPPFLRFQPVAPGFALPSPQPTARPT